MNTIQKNAVYEYLKHSEMHPTAETIYSELKTGMPMLSLGTVYRNLNLLYKGGKVKVIDINNKRRYEGRDLHHDHFVCTNCERIYDIKVNLNVDIGKIEEISIYGVCKSCWKNGS